jgi:hypothetical protein
VLNLILGGGEASALESGPSVVLGLQQAGYERGLVVEQLASLALKPDVDGSI